MGQTLNTEGQVMIFLKSKPDDCASLAIAGMLLALGLAGVTPAVAQEDEPPLPPVVIDNDADKLGVQPPPAEEPEQAMTPEDEAEAQADEAADQAALESELASAKRFEVELAALLQADGQLETTRGDFALTKLASLATRCGILANSAMHDEVRFVLLSYQARALAALVSLEPVNQQQDPSRVEQLHEVAEQIGQLEELPGSQATADYWALLAAMADQNQSQTSPAQQRALTEWTLSRFIERHAEDEHAAEYLMDTRLSLAQLLDQRGAQREVAQLLEQVGTLPPDSPRAQEFNRLRSSVARLGTLVQFESISTQLTTWRSSDHLGKPVLIHIYADQVESSVRMIDVISRSIVEGKISGIAVVSLRVGEPIAASASPPWPALPVQLEPKGVLDQLGVAALPTLAWLDEDGKLASIGTAAAVLDQLESLKPEVIDEPDKEEPDAAQNFEAQPDEPTPVQPDEQDAFEADSTESDTP